MEVGVLQRLRFRFRIPRLTRARTGRLRRRARVALFLSPLFLIIGMAAMWSVADHARPAATDPDYVTRRQLLRERQAEQPDAHLYLFLGSSRCALGFVPEMLTDVKAPDGSPALWFNFSHFGAGPVLELIILNRLLQDGVRPEMLVIEVMPPFVAKEREPFLGHFLNAAEIAEASKYVRTSRIVWHALKNRYAQPDQLKRAVFGSETVSAGSHGGPTNLEGPITSAERERRYAFQYEFHNRVIRNFTIPAGADVAHRELVKTCRANGIVPVLVLSPEGPRFQALYDPECWARFQNYLEGFASENNLRLINARDWLDEEDFMDSHHPLRSGAEKFTRRLMSELMGSTTAINALPSASR